MKTVEELIKDLGKFDLKLPVIVDGFEYGYDDVDLVCIKKLERVSIKGGSYPIDSSEISDNTLESEKVNHLYIGNQGRLGE